jgi:transcriptional regulator with XRE-family HTH domain
VRDEQIEADVGRLVKAEMRRQHVSQLELANRIGVSPKLISNRLTGKSRFCVVDLYTIATALGVHPRMFLP